MSKIVITRSLNFPAAQVWDALTDSHQLSNWLMENDFKPILGRQFQFKTDPAPGFDGRVNCEVLDITPQSRLSFSWASGNFNSTVRFDLQETSNGTDLTITHDGFGFKDIIGKTILKAGWKKLLGQKLPSHLSELEMA
jgi:uncharacterized protein YndB with AHSA1/START domain